MIKFFWRKSVEHKDCYW